MATREPQASQPPEETETLLGAVINGRYRIESVIARGGMGKVYKAEQSALGRVCAIKILSPHYEGNKDPEFHRRFSLEASTAAKLQHPNTVTIFDYGKCELHNVYYIAMEFLDGRTLHRVMHDERTLTEARASHIAQQIARSVHEAHRLGVVHRDLKPSNVLLVERGDEPDFVKVLDFGLVKDVTGKGEDLTQTGLFMGSPKYMAPEQVMGGDISPRTDVYSLGVMLYEMIAGKVPFDRKAGMSTLVAHVNEAPPPISIRNPNALVSPDMEAIVMRCLEKEPEKRFPSMKDLLNHLKRAGGDLSETYESLPRARIDYDAAMRSGGGADSGSGPKNRLSAPPPSISGTLRSPLISPQAASGALEQASEASGPTSGPAERSGPTGESSDSHSLPQASRSMPAPVDRPSAMRPYLFAVLTSVIGGGTAAVVLSRRNEPPPGLRPAESAVPAAAVAIAVSPTGEAPRGPDIRILRIESDPSGAQVSDHGVQVCMSTPCDVYWRGAAAKLEHQLSLSKRGFKTTLVTVAPTVDSVQGKLDVYGPNEIQVPGPLPVGGQSGPGRPETPATASPSTTAEAKPEPSPPPPVATVAAVAPPPQVAPPPPAPTPEPPPPAPVAGPMHAGDVDTRATRLSCPSLTPSREAREAKVSGTIIAKCVVTETGSVTSCHIIKGLPFMDGPALAYFSSCRYTPAMAGGKPVATEIPMTIKLAE